MDLKHFVTFFYKGNNGDYQETFSIKSDKVSSLRIPARALGFKLFDRPSEDITVKGEKIISKDTEINASLYYIGKIISLEEIKEKYGEESDMYQEMLEKKYYGGVITRENTILPLRLNEQVNILAPAEVHIDVPSQVEDETASER